MVWDTYVFKLGTFTNDMLFADPPTTIYINRLSSVIGWSAPYCVSANYVCTLALLLLRSVPSILCGKCYPSLKSWWHESCFF